MVVELLRDKKLAKRLGEKARRRIWTAFSWNKNARNVEIALQSMDKKL